MVITDTPPTLGRVNPLDDARKQLREAVDILGYEDSIYSMLAVPGAGYDSIQMDLGNERD